MAAGAGQASGQSGFLGVDATTVAAASVLFVAVALAAILVAKRRHVSGPSA
jgi:hypothetical protein